MTFRAPQAAAEAIAAMAAYFELSTEALIRRYVAAGLQQDEARYFSEQALATVEDVLSGHLADPELVAVLIGEARAALSAAGLSARLALGGQTRLTAEAGTRSPNAR